VPWALVPRGPWALAPALTLVIALCAWPAVSLPAAGLPLSPLALAALAARELLIGVVYALALGLPLRAFEWAGALGGRFAAQSAGAEPFARLQLFAAVAAFFSLGGHRVAIAALADSVVRTPVGVLAAPADAGALALGSARMVADAVELALLLALPVAAAVVIAEIALSLSARAASASGLLLASAPLRAGLGLAVIWMGALLTLTLLPREIERGLAAAGRLLQEL
jgi:flagellar biosynthetic protein FliR